MNNTARKIIVCIFALALVFSLSLQSLAADDIQAETIETVDSDEPEMALSDTVAGSFDQIEGYEIATIRYFVDADKRDYHFADFTYDENTGKYNYSFATPYSGFTAVQGIEMRGTEPAADATIIAYYYSLSRWDGAVDVSWYNETDSDFYVYDPAQLAGVAAIVNGNIDGQTEPYEVKGARSDLTGAANKGLPDYIVSDHYEETSLAAQARGPANKGRMEHDFENRTIHLMADLDMGGTDGSNVLMGSGYDIAIDNPDLNWNRNLHKDEYPNWTPIGGEYLMDVEDYETMNIAFFNGFLDGNGHSIDNIYCYRWSYRKEGYTAFGYSQGVGLIGAIACLYSDDRGDEPQPDLMPGVKDLAVSGFVYGRRMVGGVVGVVGGGQSSVEGGVISSGVTFENIANHAYVYCTDAKGLGGIIGASHISGNIINCYNTGRIEANYAAPTGGIIGSNEAMDIFCCYSTGTVTSNGNNRGRGIGADNAGSDYTVDNCYYLYGTVEDTRFPGYYDDEAGKNVYVNVNPVNSAQLTDGTLLAGLNQNGTAYVEGDDGYPVLYWEKYAGTGSLWIDDPIGGTISASTSKSPVLSGDVFDNGTVVYFTNEEETGYKFRYYTLNGKKMSGDYVTINGECVVSAVYESSKAGVLKIAENDVCDISVTKNGIIIENGETITVTDHPVASGDEIFEGDLLTVTASVKEGKVPDDPDLIYSYFAGMENCFDYGYTYTGSEEEVTALVTYTVSEKINEDDVSLTLDVKPRTTQKLWRYVADTSWYNESDQEFVLTTAAELAGLGVLVDAGNSFSGKTIKLGSDISFTNTDGTNGKRFWDGMGSTAVGFAGIFDGQGHKITDFHSNQNALFSFLTGTSASSPTIVKDLEIYGTADGANACGIAYTVKNANITNCSTYVSISGTSGYIGGIAGHLNSGSSVSNCVSYGSIVCNTTGSVYIGGIVGRSYNGNSISNCINKGNIQILSDNNNYIGGIVGQNYSPITECANYGSISGHSRYIGGLCGQAIAKTAEIRDCYNAGNVTLASGSNSLDCVGGLIGFGSIYVIENSFNVGTVALDDRECSNIGGLVGKENKNSNSRTENAYMLDTSCKYVDNAVTYENLTTASYHAGMKIADAAAFASPTGVINIINNDNCFVLSNAGFPEFGHVADLHVHSGGIATCVDKAVCKDCGLEYGSLDSQNHKETYRKNASAPAWIYDGYTGDEQCLYCGTIISQGEPIPADSSVQAITINILENGEITETRSYTRAEFDLLKETEPIAYGYGTRDDSEMMAATEYVTLDTILDQFGYTIDDVLEIVVKCAGTTDVVDHDSLVDKCEYHENGQVYSAPAAIAMKYTTGYGSLATVAAKAEASNNLRFGYGISAQQYEETVDVGGRRCVSPVLSLDIKTQPKEIIPIPDQLFDDVQDPTAWYFDTVYNIAKTKNANGKPLMSGYGNSNNFGPADPLARQDFAVILHRLADEPEVEDMENPFHDTDPDGYYYTCVLWAKANNVIAGYNDGRFGVGDKITREQVATILYRFAKDYMKIDTSAALDAGDLTKFNDGTAVSDWATEALTWAIGAGVITGKSEGTEVAARGDAARAEIGAMVLRFITYAEKNR